MDAPECPFPEDKMNTETEATKKEVATKYGYDNWVQLLFHEGAKHVDEAMELYHSRKCEEAVKELPDNDKIFESARNHFIGGVATDRNFDCYVSGQKDMRRQASKLLASKESQLLQLGMDGQVMQGEHEQIVESLNSKLEAKNNEIGEMKDKLMELDSTINTYWSQARLDREEIEGLQEKCEKYAGIVYDLQHPTK